MHCCLGSELVLLLIVCMQGLYAFIQRVFPSLNWAFSHVHMLSPASEQKSGITAPLGLALMFVWKELSCRHSSDVS